MKRDLQVNGHTSVFFKFSNNRVTAIIKGLFSIVIYFKKHYAVTSYQNRLGETVLMRGHNICFC